MSTNQNITQTSIVKPPSYVEGPAKAFSQRITSLLDPSKIEVDPSKFQEQVAGLSPLQQQAAQMAATQAGLGTLSFDPSGAVSGVGQGTGIAGVQPFLSAAAGMTGPQAAQAFMSPFQQQVIDATRQSFQETEQQVAKQYLMQLFKQVRLVVVVQVWKEVCMMPKLQQD